MATPPLSRVRLGAGREFDLIRDFLGPETELPPDVWLGPGDDAAILEGGWVISTDLAVEDVHFRRGWLTDEEIGYRATAAALSDLAAMAARPVGVLVSMAVPRGGAVDVAALQSGVRQAVRSVGGEVIGGDLSRSPGPLFLDLVVLGRAERPVTRVGARPGDEVWVSGTLGTGAAALDAWTAGQVPSEPLRARFARPFPRVDLALALVAQAEIVAMLDLSDGLAGDAGHLAAASGVGVVLEEGAVPVDPEVRAALGDTAALDAALYGGEDFELCFVVRPGALDAAGGVGRFGVPLTRVGRVVAREPDAVAEEGRVDVAGGPGPAAAQGPASWVMLEGPGGGLRPVDRGGYDHWSAS